MVERKGRGSRMENGTMTDARLHNARPRLNLSAHEWKLFVIGGLGVAYAAQSERSAREPGVLCTCWHFRHFIGHAPRHAGGQRLSDTLDASDLLVQQRDRTPVGELPSGRQVCRASGSWRSRGSAGELASSLSGLTDPVDYLVVNVGHIVDLQVVDPVLRCWVHDLLETTRRVSVPERNRQDERRVRIAQVLSRHP